MADNIWQKIADKYCDLKRELAEENTRLRAELAEAKAAKSVDLDTLTAAVMALARHNISPDIQGLLMSGNPMRNVAPRALEAAIAAAVEAERERCAKVAETKRMWPSSFTFHDVCRSIAATIRGGGNG